jgi:hypothetical protein
MFNKRALDIDPIARILTQTISSEKFGTMWSEKLASKPERLGIRRFTRSIAHWGEANLFIGSGEYGASCREETAPILKHKTCNSADLLRLKKMYLDTDTLSKVVPLRVLGSSKKSLDNFSENKSQKSTPPTNSFRRIIIVKNIVPNSGVTSILNQVYGGPLERLVYNANKKSSSLELFFVYPEDAKRFLEFGSSGMLVVNGRHLKLEWAGRSNSDLFDKIHPTVSKQLLREIEHYGSRRCLIFSKPVPGKIVRSDKKLFYPNPKVHFSRELDIEKIKQDFTAFGDIINVGPVISRKLCFSIQYTDIRSAIMAKRDCESEGSDMNIKYGSWSIWYGTDTADKPCPEL